MVKRAEDESRRKADLAVQGAVLRATLDTQLQEVELAKAERLRAQERERKELGTCAVSCCPRCGQLLVVCRGRDSKAGV